MTILPDPPECDVRFLLRRLDAQIARNAGELRELEQLLDVNDPPNHAEPLPSNVIPLRPRP